MCSAVGEMHPVGQAGSTEVAVWQGGPGSMTVATSYIYNQSGTLLRERMNNMDTESRKRENLKNIQFHDPSKSK